MNRRVLWLVAGLACAGAGCGSTSGEGTLQVTAYAESFVEEGIGADDMADGWSVAFERFDVSVANVSVAGVPVVVVSSVELTQPSAGTGQLLGEAQIPAGRYADASYELTRARVVGVASRGGQDKSFDWVFEERVRYSGCEALTQVRDSEASTLQLTFHADHLFGDSLVAEEPALRFQALADADANGDGRIELEELAASGLGAYDPGNDDEVQELRGWLRASARSMGHINGEAHCDLASLGGSAGE